jgi:thiamine-monophosphate kinase
MDLSDGLGDALRQVAAASGVGFEIDAAALPVDEEVRRWHERAGTHMMADVLSGGDDYELLFTVRPTQRGRLRGVLSQLGALPVTRIGVATRSRNVLLRDENGRRELPPGYEHFRPGPSAREQS